MHDAFKMAPFIDTSSENGRRLNSKFVFNLRNSQNSRFNRFGRPFDNFKMLESLADSERFLFSLADFIFAMVNPKPAIFKIFVLHLETYFLFC